jgi:GxxExxY protein
LELNDIIGQIIAAALKIHTAIGPGLLESVYQTCLHHELQKRGLQSQIEVPLPVIYDDLRVDSKFRLDLVVEDRIIVETKCVDAIAPIHKAQLLTYLRLANKPLGLLLNFNVVHMKDGIKRVVNNRYQQSLGAARS